MPPSLGMSLDATKKQAMEAAQEDAGSSRGRQTALGCGGDTSLSCNSIRPRGGFTWQFLGQFTAQDEKKWVSWMPEKLLNFFHSPVLSLPRLVHDHVSPGPLQQLFLRCSSSGYRNGLQDSEDYSVICHSQWQTGMGVYTGAEWEGPRYG